MKYKMRVTYECTLVRVTEVEVEADSVEDAMEAATSKVQDEWFDADDWAQIDEINGEYYAERVGEEIMRKEWGSRCAEYEPGCPVCEAWKWFNEKSVPPEANDPAFNKQCKDALNE